MVSDYINACLLIEFPTFKFNYQRILYNLKTYTSIISFQKITYKSFFSRDFLHVYSLMF